jgi:myo-inositol 2-dehydrogenase/D-chiro-inositol 1-dehydrogenase
MAYCTSPDYYERFKGAFVREVNVFTDCVLDQKRESPLFSLAFSWLVPNVDAFAAVLTTAADGLAAAEIAVACTHSFRTGKVVYFGDDGKPILD